MKLKLNKKKLKNLSKDNKSLPADMTPQVGGGKGFNSFEVCPTYDARCTGNYTSRAC
ncbi:hypothetical protein [Pseudoalteromonas denitrificans]|uniref:Uncharacterized protein n=1 Tax=Pseudoalteromonas denitrificans DSM 6059 TaxID=1123010 RepID=A0A1I1U850_9GAMM|nr:hypothetical protein [Pseudoalteromonas denitrificans]SFD64903.1 hypothetical protein SAMN02745724_05084 [Pseudoalteromonas denitrificans DSM 6059]